MAPGPAYIPYSNQGGFMRSLIFIVLFLFINTAQAGHLTSINGGNLLLTESIIPKKDPFAAQIKDVFLKSPLVSPSQNVPENLSTSGSEVSGRVSLLSETDYIRFHLEEPAKDVHLLLVNNNVLSIVDKKATAELYKILETSKSNEINGRSITTQLEDGTLFTGVEFRVGPERGGSKLICVPAALVIKHYTDRELIECHLYLHQQAGSFESFWP